MSHSNTVLSQLLKLMPRHEFVRLANQANGKVRCTALSRWSQFVALTVGQLIGRQSLRDIESRMATQQHLHYHLGLQSVSKPALARANENRDAMFYTRLFEVLYQRCTNHTGGHGFRFKKQIIFTGWDFVGCLDEAVAVGRLQSQESGFQITHWSR